MNTDQMLTGIGQTLPMLIVIIGGMLTMLMAVAKNHKEPDIPEARPYLAVSLLAVMVALAVLTQIVPQKAAVWNGTLAIDRLALVGQGLLLAIAGVAMCMGAASMTEQAIVRGEYFALTLFATSGMMLMVSATELLTFFVGLEIMSLAVYVLVGFRRSDRWSQEAALKYFLNGAFASAFFMFGAALLYGVSGSTDYHVIATFAQRPDAATSLLFVTGALMCIIGFAFKVAAVPFHMWAPDAYQGAPTMVTAFMAVAVKAAAFIAFMRFALLVGAQTALPKLEPLLVGLAIATMTLGNLSAVLQRNVKRMLAYSSIAQAGYLLVGLIGALRKGETGVEAVLFYLFVYGLATLGAFGVLIALERRGGRHDEQLINRYAGQGFVHPGLGVAFAICMFALSGIPPTSGFLGKVLLFGPALDAGHVWLVVIAVLNSVVSVYYYLRVVVYMFMKSAPPKATEVSVSSPWLNGALALTSLLVLIVGMMPADWLGVFTKIL